MCPLGHGTASGGDRSRSVTAPSPSRRGGGGSATLLPLPPAHPSTGADSVSVLIDTPVLSGSQPSATLTIGVTAAGGGPVAGDEVTLATIGEPEAACGTLQAASVTTDRSRQATLTYSRSATAGFCAVSATEQRTGQAGFVMVDQEPASSASATRDTVAVAASGRSAAGGGSAAALTVAVETRGGAAVAGDAVWLTPYGVGCGSLSANVGITDGSGRLTVGYTAAAAGEGSCPNPMSDNDGLDEGLDELALVGAEAGQGFEVEAEVIAGEGRETYAAYWAMGRSETSGGLLHVRGGWSVR